MQRANNSVDWKRGMFNFQFSYIAATAILRLLTSGSLSETWEPIPYNRHVWKRADFEIPPPDAVVVILAPVWQSFSSIALDCIMTTDSISRNKFDKNGENKWWNVAERGTAAASVLVSVLVKRTTKNYITLLENKSEVHLSLSFTHPASSHQK